MCILKFKILLNIIKKLSQYVSSSYYYYDLFLFVYFIYMIFKAEEYFAKYACLLGNQNVYHNLEEI